MKQGGFDEKKIKVVCNFVDPEKVKDIKVNTERKDYYAYVGRLSAEKEWRRCLRPPCSFRYH